MPHIIPVVHAQVGWLRGCVLTRTLTLPLFLCLLSGVKRGERERGIRSIREVGPEKKNLDHKIS